MKAVEHLLNLTINDGWVVSQHLTKSAASTGGIFSESYLAKKGDKIAFLKAFDFSDAFEPGVDPVTRLLEHAASYDHERNILEHLGNKRPSNVVLAIGHGQIAVPKFSSMEGRVMYLLFEKADTDIRCQMDVADSSDYVWCMRVLRDVCLGLYQVHKEFIAHQDLKPSNVLSYNDEVFKIADFGRSSKRGTAIWHDDVKFPGDRTYCPPELLYGLMHSDFVPRRIGSDMFMLGNLAAFLFTGTNMTSAILSKMAPEHHWSKWGADYASVLPYVQEAFGRALEDLDNSLPHIVRREVLEFVASLCNPDLAKRGYPKTQGTNAQYSLERYLSKLTNTVKALEVKARVAARVA